MKIINLMDDEKGVEGCVYSHGLSYYIETKKHKILMDLGPSEETLANAKKRGVDLSSVDTVVLSHGHYDHSGGILAFAKINPQATIYMQKTAGKEFYSDDGEEAQGERYRFIGIDQKILELLQVKQIEGDAVIDDELALLTIKNRTHKLPSTNRRMMVKDGESYISDDFEHEQCLVIKDGQKWILMSGCAHNGILSIMDAFIEKYKAAPDVVISGFHLMKKTDYNDEEIGEIIDIAKALKQFPTQFYTGHCTGIAAYKVMKNIMGDRLVYVHSGEEVRVKYPVTIQKKERRPKYMKWHIFFAWATVVCFIMTMVTGYKRK